MTPYYDHAGVTIYHGDCREVLPELSASVCITDPPYGVGFKGEEWDAEIPEIAKQLPGMFATCAIITGTLTLWDYPRPKWVACWARPASSSRSKVGGFSHWSPVLLYGNAAMPVDFKSFHAIQHAQPRGFEHPSPKPEILMRWLVSELCPEGQALVDPFCGSGATLRAAKDLGRRAIGIEIEERYCEIAARRLSQEVLPFAEQRS